MLSNIGNLLLFSNLYEIRLYLAQLNINIDKVRIQYGGSVNGSNSHSLSKIEHVDGFLIGGSSQDAKKFIDIIKKTYN